MVPMPAVRTPVASRPPTSPIEEDAATNPAQRRPAGCREEFDTVNTQGRRRRVAEELASGRIPPHEPAVCQVGAECGGRCTHHGGDGHRAPAVRVRQSPPYQHTETPYGAGELLEHGDAERAVVPLVAQELGLELRGRCGEQGQ